MNFHRYRDLGVLLLALAIPFWFLRVTMRDPSEMAGPDRFLLKIAAPVQKVAAAVGRSAGSVVAEYVYLVDVRRENQELTTALATERAKVRELERAAVEVDHLRRLLDFKRSLPVQVVTASVLNKTTNDFFRVIRLSLDKDNVTIDAGLPVIVPEGVVGTTQKASGTTVDVRLVVDAGSGVDVVVERTGARGFVRGTGEDARHICNVQYVERADEVEEGDLLVTSGVARFPKGLPVARVTKIVRREFGVYQQVEASPVVDFSRLQHALIVLTQPEAVTPP